MSLEPSNEQVQTDLGSKGPWSFTLDHKRAPAGLSANDRTHWRAKAASTAALRTEVVWGVRALRLQPMERVQVDVEWVVATTAVRDPDNLAPMTKAIYDAIGSNKGTSARLVADDDPAHMVKPAPTIRYEKGVVPHFEITITDLGDSR